jgi:hypothetical protein
MPSTLPPHLQLALTQLDQALQRVDQQPLDLLKASWADIEKRVARVLMGAFDPSKPEHQAVALGLAAALGERFAQSDGGFWFPHRESPEGAMLGFPEALLMLSPLGAVLEALGRAKLPALDDVGADVRRAQAQARFSPNAQTRRLDPEMYARLFDPGLVQFAVLDPAKAKQAWESKPDGLARDLRDALARTEGKLPADARTQMDQQLVGSLTRLDPGQPLIAQLARGPRMVELMGHLFGTITGTGAAPEEFWAEVVFPLLHIGAPTQFPPLDADEMKLLDHPSGLLELYLDAVPYQTPASEDGLMGVFSPEQLDVPHPELAKVGTPRMIKLGREPFDALVAKLDVAASRESLAKFATYAETQRGKPAATSSNAESMKQAAFTLLSDLKRLQEVKGDLVMRRLTEAEATSEAALAPVRQALQAPRIILT